jgi:hypothetical protein
VLKWRLGTAIMLLLGLCGFSAVGLCTFTYLGWREDMLGGPGTISTRERYLIAALCSPLAITYLGTFVALLYRYEHESYTWVYLFILTPLWIILTGTVRGLSGGIQSLLDKNSGDHWISWVVTTLMLVFFVYAGFFHEAPGIAAHRSACEAKGQKLEQRRNTIDSGSHYACSGDPQPRYRRY